MGDKSAQRGRPRLKLGRRPPVEEEQDRTFGDAAAINHGRRFHKLFDGTLTGWRMAGPGRFKPIGDALETEGGMGLLWHAERAFRDFILRVDWRAQSVEDNSGVFLRFPPLESGDPQVAVERGYEVQIDDRGIDHDAGRTGSPLHLTGAIYKLAPAPRLASRPIGDWNRFEITARGLHIAVRLNGEAVSHLDRDVGRPLEGHIGLQNHHAGSRVQFRDIEIAEL